MNYALFHQITFYVMYAALALACFVIVERMIFYGFTLRRARSMEMLLTADGYTPNAVAEELDDRVSVPGETLQKMLNNRRKMRTRNELEDLSEAIYLAMKARLQRHLWVLDTVVTAAPLLGLLGTILGIIETFQTLAQSGISDPSGVSAGIGTALFATGLGIAIALFGLVFFNLFQERVERIGEHLKIIILHTGLGIMPADEEGAHHAYTAAAVA